MKKIIYIILILSVIPAMAQQDLQQLLGEVKNPYMKIDEIDAVVRNLKRIPANGLDTAQQKILFESYRLAAERYAGNNHFKQAYMLYDEYLGIKEKALAAEKAKLISATVSGNNEKQQHTIDAVKTLKAELDILEKNENQLQARSNNFIRNISLLVILLAVIFVLLFLRISWKLRKVKESLQENRTQLMGMEKAALIGRLHEQIEKSSDKQLAMISSEITSIQALVKQTESSLTREQMPVFKKIKDTFSKAEDDMKNLQHMES